MDRSTRLRAAERKTALHAVRRGSDPEFRLRAHILPLLDGGQPWALIAAVLFASAAAINRWRRRFLARGLDGVLSRPRRSPCRWWAGVPIRRATERTPADFGFVRSRWACETVAVMLRDGYRIRVRRYPARGTRPMRTSSRGSAACRGSCRPARWPCSGTRWTSTPTCSWPTGATSAPGPAATGRSAWSATTPSRTWPGGSGSIWRRTAGEWCCTTGRRTPRRRTRSGGGGGTSTRR